MWSSFCRIAINHFPRGSSNTPVKGCNAEGFSVPRLTGFGRLLPRGWRLQANSPCRPSIAGCHRPLPSNQIAFSARPNPAEQIDQFDPVHLWHYARRFPATGVGSGAGAALPARFGRSMVGYFTGVSAAYCQFGVDANLRNPCRSGSCSISDAMMAGSILRCSLVVLEENHCPGCQVFDSH